MHPKGIGKEKRPQIPHKTGICIIPVREQRQNKVTNTAALSQCWALTGYPGQAIEVPGSSALVATSFSWCFDTKRCSRPSLTQVLILTSAQREAGAGQGCLGSATQKINGSLPAEGCQSSQALLTRAAVPRPLLAQWRSFFKVLCAKGIILICQWIISWRSLESGANVERKGKEIPYFIMVQTDVSGELHQHAAHVKFNTPPNAFRWGKMQSLYCLWE